MTKRYLEWAETTPALISSLVLSLAMLFFVFPALPVGGVLLDVMPGLHSRGSDRSDGRLW
ncbi:MAG: hypothetical protein F4089_07235 [Gammaproteobacteria bacterium]|nr:hypothetical protein [Acidobacteriota bacterium]MYA15270.1 hypothetical protein [Gammaproteobacteria bacterium]MYJ74896.1 hypothetical protein [Gammaproteobacteria bacterium]